MIESPAACAASGASPLDAATSALRRAASVTNTSVPGRYFGLLIPSTCEYDSGRDVPVQLSGRNLSRAIFALTPQLIPVFLLPNLCSRAWNAGSILERLIPNVA